ncbi:MAG TPA: alpha/beta fold hydrolase, partial [Caldilineaceae bacterium]|nr:alpha/beta fold hydrolase [Caldilineaceae bacterium]
MTSAFKPDPAAFLLTGGPVGIMLMHGFTGSPSEMSLIGPYLQQRGLTVSVPLLPGHGTTPADLNRQRLEDWVAHVQTALADLQRQCQVVFLGGLSFGALLALYMAAEQPQIAGVVLYSPALLIADKRSYLVPLLKYIAQEVPK